MTETQAQAKWCPFASITPDDGHAPGNRYYDDRLAQNHGSGCIPADGCYCLGRGCALWSWLDEEAGIGRCGA